MDDSATAIDWSWQGKPLRLGVTRLGAGPSLLLLPALSSISTRAEMRPLQTLLADSYATVSVDWPGFGDRPKPMVDWRPAAYRAFLAEVLATVAPAPRATIAVGHAAAYLLQQAAAKPGSAGALCLIAPTWRGPLPTVSKKAPATFEWFARLVDAPGIGALVYGLNVNKPVLRMMGRGHVYADAGFLTPEKLVEKMQVTQAPGARHASVRFVTGLLDPAADRAAFLADAARVRDPVLLLYGAGTPRRSRAEMEALAALPNVETHVLARGKLAVQEEAPREVADFVRAFVEAASAAA
jgi:pimeloyl-ACP methyl ester carboxylesterase